MVARVTSNSARLGQSRAGNTVISIRFNNNGIIRLTDEVTNNFRSGKFYRALSDVNERAAIAIQEGQVEELKSHIGRRTQRGGERLAHSILDKRNRDVLANSFTVGIESWLDQSPAALYWRRIEEGDNVTFNSVILFTDDFNKYFAPRSPGGHSARAGRSAMARGKNSGTFKMPVGGSAEGANHMRMPQHMAKGVFVMAIGPFPAYRYSAGGIRAWQRFKIKQQYIDHLQAVGIKVSKGTFK